MKLDCRDLAFSYSERPLFRQLSLQIENGEHVLLRGPSGSGKSTLLQILAGFLQPTAGSMNWGATNAGTLSESERREFRQNRIGYVHQENDLIAHWSVLQNLQLVADCAASRATELLLEVGFERGLVERVLAREARYLSGGERQRVNLARVLLQNPDIVLLDEPTAHLDDLSTDCVLKLIASRLKAATVVVVSHDSRLAQHPFRLIQFNELTSAGKGNK